MNICLLASWIKRYHLDSSKLWKEIVDFKYETNSLNIFCCPQDKGSPFWKGVMWAMQAAKMGYTWVVGNGKKIRFWEDQWFGNSSLPIHFGHLYAICNEQGKTVEEVWDGNNLKLTFRRTVNEIIYNSWLELVAIAESICYKEETDKLVWKYNSNGLYSTQTLYAVISYGGVQPVYPPVIWEISVAPRIQVFLWLMSNNKFLTRDNLAKRRTVADKTCVFCSETESVDHLFFKCLIAQQMWEGVADICDKKTRK